MEAMEVKPCFVGIDVSKDKLDIYVLPQKEYVQVENKDFKELCKRLKAYSPRLIVMEASGGYEVGAYQALSKAGFTVSREQAINLHHYRRSRGKRAKTDPIDAETLAYYAQSHLDTIRAIKPRDEVQEHLKQLMDRRADLVKIRIAEKNRANAPAVEPRVQASTRRTLAFLETEIARLEKRIQKAIDQQAELHKKQALLTTVPGVGETVAQALLGWLPELGQLGNKAIAALVGVAPYHHESGKYKGERHIQGGRAPVRHILYMATMSAIRYNPILKAYYQSLTQKGKPKRVALVACAHKLLRILNAMLREQKDFQTA